MKVFRVLGLTILGIIVLLVGIILIATLVIDPNTYKPQIEKVVERRTRLDLTLAGDIDWSLLPLGLTLNDVSADLDGELFARLDTLVAQVDPWSLLRFEPEVSSFVLEGMTANLVRDAEGQGNWERIMPEPSPVEGDAEPVPAETTEAPTEAGQSQPLQFQIEEVQITNAELRYSDEASGQELLLDQVDLSAQNIALGSSFPLDLSFHFTTNQPALDVNGSLSAVMEASEDLQRFSVRELDSNFELGGEPIGEETVEAALAGNANIDLEAEAASLGNFRAELANLVVKSELKVSGFGESPQLSGTLAIEPFSARELLDSLGLDPIETQDPEVLENLALSTNIGGPAGQVELSDFTLTLDETQFTGTLEYGVANQAIGVALQGNQLNLDRYLPPPSAPAAGQEDPTAGTAAPANPVAAAEETDLLPLETLRGLMFGIELGLEELIVKNLSITDLAVEATGENGVVRIDPLKGNLYEGDFLLTAELDARKDTPVWQVNQRLNGVQTMPLLTDLLEMELLSGQVNLKADVETRGNRISALRENADGTASFEIDDGAFESVNLTAYACEGIALANRESIATRQWPQRTEFEDLSGVMAIEGNILRNESLNAVLAGMDMEGEGTIDLTEMLLDYELGLRIVGAIHEDNACRVNERIQNIVIPVECRGELEEAGGICSFDGSRFRDVLKDMAAAEAKRKASEKVDKAVDRQLDKFLGEDEEDQSETRKQIKDAVKGLFN